MTKTERDRQIRDACECKLNQPKEGRCTRDVMRCLGSLRKWQELGGWDWKREDG